MNRQLILASGSPRRKQLLEQIGLEFTVVPSAYEEDMTLPMDPEILAKHLAHGKAAEVADKYSQAVVIGADSMVIFDGEVIGKPKSEDEAKEMLKRLSGKKNQVVTGLSVICRESGQELAAATITDVYLRAISGDEIEEYVASGEPLDKAGSYAVQDRGGVFVEKIVGDYSGIVGLPLAPLWHLLQEIER